MGLWTRIAWMGSVLLVVTPNGAGAGLLEPKWSHYWTVGSLLEAYWLVHEPGAFGRRMAVGDFDGDGFDDLVIGDPWAGRGPLPGAPCCTAFPRGMAMVAYGGPAGIDYEGNEPVHPDVAGVPGELVPGDNYGDSLAAGDFNGDGIDDLAVGSPGKSTDCCTNSGIVHVFYGDRRYALMTSVGVHVIDQNTNGILGISEDHDRFGASLASADFDGDGFDDLVIGVPGQRLDAGDEAGMINVVYGSESGLATPGNQAFSQGFNGLRGVEGAGHGFGSVLATGDFDHDGYADLAVGVYRDSSNRTESGAVHVIYGSSSGLNANGNQLWDQDTRGVLGVSEAGDRFGESLAIGDFNGDQYDDLAVGAPGQELSAGPEAGMLNVLYGSATGLESDGNQTFSQGFAGLLGTERAGNRFGAALTSGDFDADGITDLAIGNPGEDTEGLIDAGAAQVVYGSSDGLTTSHDQYFAQHRDRMPGTPEEKDQFGAALVAGNFDGRGGDELVIAAIGEKSSGGAIQILHGGALCGNGVLDQGEQCDPGRFGEDADTCSSVCETIQAPEPSKALMCSTALSTLLVLRRRGVRSEPQ